MCAACGSADLELMGQMGNLAHIRCRSCGAWTSIPADELETDEPTDETE